ncbi:D-arabinono-1,4-lactone oxidase [Microbacterium album]|uniref:Oxidoreductase n=1 Tax=Microbacterium album TaxID=2053191 RepID=A0A917MMD8_9MICO|nr:D-arabinono-1,4-lactone oxidase [Microbacterium album]GGH47921.1 oxidoreductase [Microbacterium album]
MTERFRNWSGSLEFEYARRERPRSEEEIQEIVRAAREEGRTVRPVGSGHSSTPLVETDGVLVDFEHLHGLTAHDEDALTATLLPGTTLENSGELLADVGLGMENLGDVDYQTIAGAIGTGTHGTGLELGNVSSNVIGGWLVTGTGEVRAFGVDAGTDGHDDLTRAARVSLGALGMFSALTLRVLPYYRLHRRNFMTHVDWTLDHFDELVSSSRHFDFYWYPRRDETQVRLMDRPDEDQQIDAPVDEYKREDIGPSHHVITNDRDLRFEEMEYMFPLERGMEVFRAVRERVKERHRQHVGWRVLVRVIAEDDGLLSNCNGGPTMTIALLQNNVLDYHDYFDDLEPLFLDFGGRPHWGKKHSQTAEQLRGMYPEWDRFQQIRRELDPDGVYLNAHLRELLGEGTT